MGFNSVFKGLTLVPIWSKEWSWNQGRSSATWRVLL